MKPGPRHLRNGPDPRQTRLGPHMGIPSGLPHAKHVIVIILHSTYTLADGRYINQGCWSWGEDVAGTALSRTRVALQSRGPGNTHREVTYLSWAAPPYAYACGCVLACGVHMRTNGLLYLMPAPTQPINPKFTCEGSTQYIID